MQNQTDWVQGEGVPVTSENLLTRLREIRELKEKLELEIELLTTKLKAKQGALRSLLTQIIPPILEEAGVTMVELDNGEMLRVRNIVTCQVPKALQQNAFSWLEEQGLSGIIKNELTIPLGKGDDELVKEVASLLKDLNVAYSLHRSIHPQTLNAFARECLEMGRLLPEDLFSIYEVKTAEFK